MGCLGLPLLEAVAPALWAVLLRTWRATAEENIDTLSFITSQEHHHDIKHLLKCYWKVIQTAAH